MENPYQNSKGVHDRLSRDKRLEELKARKTHLRNAPIVSIVPLAVGLKRKAQNGVRR